MSEVFGSGRKAAAVREISKVHEETVRGTLAELAAYFTENDPRGEFVLVVAGAERDKRKNKEKAKEKRTEEEQD